MSGGILTQPSMPPDSVYAAIDVAHPYLRQAVEQPDQSSRRGERRTKNKQNSKAAHARKGIQAKCKVQCGEDIKIE